MTFSFRRDILPLSGSLLLFAALAGCDTMAEPAESSAADLTVAAVATMPASLEELPLQRMASVRDEVEDQLGWDLTMDDGNHDLAMHAGAVLVRNPSTHHYEPDPDRTGPEDGVRVILYRRSSAGDLLIPLAEAGHIDFTDESFGDEVRIGVEMVADDEVVLDLLDRSWPQDGWTEVVGPVGDLLMEARLGRTTFDDPENAFIHFDLNAPDQSRSFLFVVTVQITSAGEVEGDLILSGNVQTGPVTGGISISEASLSGTIGSLEIEGSGSVNATGGGSTHFHDFTVSGALDAIEVIVTGGDDAPPALEREVQDLLDTTLTRAESLFGAFGGDWPLDG